MTPRADDTLRYSYDWQGRRVKTELVADNGTTVSRSEEVAFDALGRITGVVNELGSFTSAYAAANLGDLPDSISLPGGFNVQVARYPANAGANALRLQSLHHRQGTDTVQKHDYAYDLAGNLTDWQRTDAASEVTAWSLRHDPASQLVELAESVDSTPTRTEGWHYDASGNLASSHVVPSGQAGSLSLRAHAGRNQLTRVGGGGKTLVEGLLDEPALVTVNEQPAVVTRLGPSGPWRFQKEVSFPPGVTELEIEAVDGNANSTLKTYSLSVGATPDQTLEYDANGNTVAQKDGAGVLQRKLEWDADNRLLAVQNAAVAAAGVKRSEFGYDGQGRRVEQVETEHDGTDWVTVSHWHYLWDGLELAQKRAAADGTVLVNYYGAGEKHGTDSLVYLSDHLGSARAWYRVSDGEVGTAEYGAFGQRQLLAAGPGEPERGYTGHLRHAASGLVLAPYRAYDAQLGRWLSEDPIMEAGGLNLYGYVGNGVVSKWDPLGLQTSAQTPAGIAVLAQMVRTGAISVDEAMQLAGGTAAAATLGQVLHQQGLIDHLDEHLRKMSEICPTGNPDPNDPDHDPVKGWIKEIKAAVKNLKQELKKLPKNKIKRKPVEEAIQRGENSLKNWGQ